MSSALVGAISAGEFMPVLGSFCTPFLGFYVKYPPRYPSPALRALNDYLGGVRRPKRA